MDTPRRPTPPVLDMTPEGEFRDATPTARGGWLDRALGRVGGVALLVAFAAGGLLLAALAVALLGLLLPVVLVAAVVGFGSLWWRARRLRGQGGVGPGAPPGAGPGANVRFFVVRR